MFTITNQGVVFLAKEVGKITLDTPQENQAVLALFRRHNHDFFFLFLEERPFKFYPNCFKYMVEVTDVFHRG